MRDPTFVHPQPLKSLMNYFVFFLRLVIDQRLLKYFPSNEILLFQSKQYWTFKKHNTVTFIIDLHHKRRILEGVTYFKKPGYDDISFL